MSTAVHAAPPKTEYRLSQGKVGGALLLLAHLPLLAAYFIALSSLPHYQFFPLALIGAGLLAHRAYQPAERRGSASFSIGCVSACGLTCLLVAVVFDSPWLGALAALFSYASWLRACCCATWSAALPSVLMAGITLRLPMGLDLWLIRELQRITARAADSVLDVLGILHTLSGNVIAVPGRRLLVEEACSGVNSLFAATACVLFYVLWTRRGWVSSILLFASIPLWVVVANVFRVVTVAVLRVQAEIAADEGLLHDALGFATFLIAVGFILSTDRLLRFYADVVEGSPVAPLAAPLAPAVASGRFLWTGIGATAAVIGLLQVPAFATRVDQYYAEWRYEPVAEWGAAALNERIDDWTRTNYETVERDRNSPFGKHSQTWTFAAGDRRALVSLDYPFHGWHELTECYETQGWVVESRQVTPGIAQGEAAVEVAMRHAADGRYGRLYFALTNRDGRSIAVRRRGEIDEWLDRAELRLRGLTGLKSFMPSPEELITYQFQLFSEAYTKPSAADDASSRRLFAAAFESLHKRLVESSAQPRDAGGTP